MDVAMKNCSFSFVNPLMTMLRVFGEQNLPFHGSSEGLYSSNNRNFLKFVEYLAEFDPIMKEHLCKVRNHETFERYLGKSIQNELIQLIASATQKKMIEAVQAAKYFSVISDCTPDVSHVEQMTMIICFVYLGKNDKEMAGNIHTEKSGLTIGEHFLAFIPLKEATDAFITDTILEKLHECLYQLKICMTNDMIMEVT
uniref:DUF4371 domain-containing protein n=1 Tax=Octopus bimaculoides TaxID=37653 RepID=A0A0L8G1C0_OCTBM